MKVATRAITPNSVILGPAKDPRERTFVGGELARATYGMPRSRRQPFERLAPFTGPVMITLFVILNEVKDPL